MAIHKPPEVACSFLGSAYESYMRRERAQDWRWGGREAIHMGRAGEDPIAADVSLRRRVVVDVILLLMRNGRILLRERANTGYGDGAYEPPSAELANRETIVETAIRLASAAGIEIGAENVSLAHVMHDVSGSGRIAFFLSVSGWTGRPASPDVRWFPVGDLPTNMLDRARVALRNYADGMRFSTYPAFLPAGGTSGFHNVSDSVRPDGPFRANESNSVNGLLGAGESDESNRVPEAKGLPSQNGPNGQNGRNGSPARRKQACGGRVLG
jgi:8-oxo-dGTP diphosphatase